MSKYQGEFDLIYNRDQCYFLGLLMSDGFVRYNNQSGAYKVQIKLKGKDVKILEKIQSRFPFFCKPRKETNCPSESRFIYCYSKDLYMDLISLGIYRHKSTKNSERVFIPKTIPNELLRDYIRGLYDGDGTIYQQSNGSIRCDFKGNNENLCKQIVNILDKADINSDFYHRKDQDQYMVRIGRKSEIKKFINYINTESDLIINRKLKKYIGIDWNRIPGYDNRFDDYKTLFIE